MNAEQAPGEIPPAGTFSGNACDHRSAARAPVHGGVGQKIALPLKAHAERRGDHRLARHWQVMQAVMEAQWETGDQHRRANFDLLQLRHQMRRRKGGENDRRRQHRPLNLDGDDVDSAAGVNRLSSEWLVVGIERHRPLRQRRDIICIDVQLDIQTVRTMIARLIQYDMPAGHQEQALIALEEKTRSAG